jgi:hypothetical protein
MAFPQGSLSPLSWPAHDANRPQMRTYLTPSTTVACGAPREATQVAYLQVLQVL